MRKTYGSWWTVALAVALATGVVQAACGGAVATTDSDAGTETDATTSTVADATTSVDAATTKDSAVANEDAESDTSVAADGGTDADVDPGTDAAADATADAGSVATYADIVINEAQSQETSGYLATDFVELFNRSSSPFTFAAGEWRVTDSDPTHVFYIPGGTTIAGGGFLVLLPDVDTVPVTAPLPPAGSLACVQDGTNSATFGLGGSDGVSLYFTGAANPTPATAIDATTWAVHVKTRARVPDGAAWSNTDVRTPTPGAANE